MSASSESDATLSTSNTLPQNQTLPVDAAIAKYDAPTSDIKSASQNVDFSEAHSAFESAQNATSHLTTSAKWETTIERVKWLLKICEPLGELHPYAKMAISVISFIPGALLKQLENDQNICKLVDSMNSAFDLEPYEAYLKDMLPNQVRILKEMLQHVCTCSNFIQEYAKNPRFSRFFKYGASGKAEAQLKELNETLQNLQKALLSNAVVSTQITALQMRNSLGELVNEVESIKLDNIIRDIPYMDGVSCPRKDSSGNSSTTIHANKGCLPGTQTAFLDYITDWINNPESSNVFMLFGQAGMGKSALAHEIAARLLEMNLLASSFVFRRQQQLQNQTYKLFANIARDLADFYPPFKVALGKIAADKTSEIHAHDYATLFKTLIYEPSQTIEFINPIVIIIDGLDESGDVSGLHTFLAQNLKSLSSKFRILITSRPEQNIFSAFSKSSLHIHIKNMDDENLSQNLKSDISSFIAAKLKNLDSKLFNQYGPQLSAKAESLFQWAAVACAFIVKPPPGQTKEDIIKQLLNLSSDLEKIEPLDQLYITVLEGYFSSFSNARVQERFGSVLGQIFAAAEPLSRKTLIALRKNAPNAQSDEADVICSIVSFLSSLLSNVASADLSGPIVPLHTSFRDFILDRKRSGKFFVDISQQHSTIAHSCLNVMLKELQFNICELETSYLANQDVPNLKLHNISPWLLYSSKFWYSHLKYLSYDKLLLNKVEQLFYTKFLFWLEVISLSKSLQLAIFSLTEFQNKWLKSVQKEDDLNQILLTKFVEDALSFVQNFSLPISISAPHIYTSALSFAPESSDVWQKYRGYFKNSAMIQHARALKWPLAKLVILAKSSVYSVAYSPDGQHIVAGSEDHTIQVWNSATGTLEAGPLKGHTGTVWSVAYSPDGQHIASGSYDQTIQVWNSATGALEAGPLKGHTHAVMSVAYSPDGQHIVSGSYDQTIRVWNSATCVLEAGPLKGHTSAVWSVAYSPDGQHIASGSDDQTIRVWNSATGALEAGPLKGHTHAVRSVAYSPDGQHIVSGSIDQTIQVWNSATGALEAGPLKGHTGTVYSVAYSLDGQHIVSGSADHTIRVWNSATGAPEAGPLQDHTGTVTSVAYSPDGQHIVSSSADHTIRVWNSATGALEAGPLKGHTHAVMSVAYSPDGQHIVSGSNDQTIRVWNSATGALEAGPLKGHTHAVRGVAYSPDGQHIVAGSEDHTIQVWNSATGALETGPLKGHTGTVYSVAYSPDGQHIASGSADHTIRVWNSATGALEAEPLKGHTSAVISVAYSPDGQHIASGSDDQTIRVWNSATGALEAEPLKGHTSAVISVAYSPDGQHIASGSDDQTIQVWNSATGALEAGPLKGHTNAVMSVAYSPDGQHIVSGSWDQTIRVWNSATATCIATISCLSSIYAIAVSSDSSYIISGHASSTVCTWNMQFAISSHLPIHHYGDLWQKFPAFSDNWIMNTDSELSVDKYLVWIPPYLQHSLLLPHQIWVTGREELNLYLSSFVHGESWAKCYIGSSVSNSSSD
ncbi:WD40-repeat-containing domain protein [Panaeolus papilionaceus]|nr:WD40-repeat-containing domain protein [Panaeolus papilionaceus]